MRGASRVKIRKLELVTSVPNFSSILFIIFYKNCLNQKQQQQKVPQQQQQQQQKQEEQLLGKKDFL